LELLREVPARQRLHARARPRMLAPDLRRRPGLLGKRQGGGEESRGIRVCAGAGGGEVAAPAVGGVARAGCEAGRYGVVELLAWRLVAEAAAVDAALGRAVGTLDLAVVERALLEVQRPARVEGETVRRVV